MSFLPINLPFFKKRKEAKTVLKLRFVNDSQSFCKGEIGTPTKFIDSKGDRIHVGDFVEVCDKELKKVTWKNYVCHSRNTSDNKVFGEYVFAIMGKSDCAQNKGVLHNPYEKVTIIKSYKKAAHGDKHDLICVLNINEEAHPETSYSCSFPERQPSDSYMVVNNFNNAEMGEWGAKTGFSDCYGIRLHVGDVVRVYDNENRFIGSHFIGVKTKEDMLSDKFQYNVFSTLVLGLITKTMFSERGFDCKIHRMERVRKFEDVKLGESYMGYSCKKKD